MTLDQTNGFLTGLYGAFGRNPRSEQRQIWEEKLRPIQIDNRTAGRVMNALQALDDFPSLGLVLRKLFEATARANSMEPVWRTWRDNYGRSWAHKTGVMRNAIPPLQEIERWKDEMAPRDIGFQAFRSGFLEAGGSPGTIDAMFRSMKPQDSGQSADTAKDAAWDEQIDPGPSCEEEVPF